MIADYLIGISRYAIVFGIPFLILVYPRQPRWPKSIWGRFMIAIFMVWILIVIHRCVSLPHVIRQAEARGNPTYDRAAINVGYFFFGWLYGIIGSLPSLIVLLFLEVRTARKLRRRDIPERQPKSDH